jgi:uncharacterized protein YndB with AHSA1/START domain
VKARERVLTRVFAAPRELVFKAWTDPAHLARWWGPQGFTNPVCEVDPRPGGALRIVVRSPSGVDYPMTGTFQEIAPPERLVFTSAAQDTQGRSVLEVQTTVTFAAHGRQTHLTVQVRVIAATDAAAPYLAGMEQGWAQSLQRLAALLAGTD